MDLNIFGQYRSIAKEQEKLRKMVEKNDRKLLAFGKYLKHVEDIRIARKQAKKKDVISQEDLFNELSL